MAIKTYKKGTATQLSTNFKSTEFDCHGSGCCSSTLVDENLVKYLQKIRSHFGKPVNVNSGYRCKTHNASVGGASKSNHMDGEAADICIDGVTPLEIAQYAEHIGMLGIGVYSWGTHVDTRTSKYFWYDGGESNVTPSPPFPKQSAATSAPMQITCICASIIPFTERSSTIFPTRVTFRWLRTCPPASSPSRLTFRSLPSSMRARRRTLLPRVLPLLS